MKSSIPAWLTGRANRRSSSASSGSMPRMRSEYWVKSRSIMSGVRSPVGRYHSESELQIEWIARVARAALLRSEEHTSELQSRFDLVCRLLLEQKNIY